jgi:hypothetical protein
MCLIFLRGWSFLGKLFKGTAWGHQNIINKNDVKNYRDKAHLAYGDIYKAPAIEPK